MYKGKLVFAQLSEHLPKEIFAASVARYAGKYPTLTFSYWDQFLCMMFAQLTARSSLRDITTCLRSHSPKLYHAGFRGPIARSTLADANERRDCRIFEEFALHLIVLARSLYANEIPVQELEQTVYAIDVTTIDLCLSLFAWAPAANARAGIKVHISLDLRGNIPAFIRITGSPVHDATFLDRAYTYFARLAKFTRAAAFFVARPRGNLQYSSLRQSPADWRLGVQCDEHIILTGQYTKHHYPMVLRRIEFYDFQQGRSIVFLTDSFELSTLQIAQLYKR